MACVFGCRNWMIAVLTAERQKLQTESDAIVYPILSLAPEITTEIFLRCRGSETYSRPYTSKGPLLLAQICHQWRQIAIHTPELWRCPQFNAISSSVDLFKLWLDRSGNLPLTISLQSWDTAQASSMIEASTIHSHHWQDVNFSLPLTLYPTLGLVNASFPMLRKITLNIIQRGGDQIVTDGVIVIRNAPLLRNAHLGTLWGVKVDIPWSQLTSLTLRETVNVADCLTLLRGCTDLVKLVVSIFGQTPPHKDSLVLPALESFHCNLMAALILEPLTLPRLQRLGITESVQPQHAVVLKNFIRRSSCPLYALSISGYNIAPETLTACLIAVSDSVSDLDVHDLPPAQLLAALEPMEILPHLKILRIHFKRGRLSETDYRDLIDVVHMRLSPPPPRGCLEGFALYSDMGPTGLLNPYYMPTVSAMARFRAFAAAGLKIKLTIAGRQATHSTHVALDSSSELYMCLAAPW
ncbi:hypothetical protein C8F04DRAFT_1107415 [Mycena alexandri]|uniref:F-box domain-containing protein n=1 Tax=Mycena alexandri TaxID=1745969 RepID=A0AAD6SR71_9AGAR|nr:hypothetical protein C8F04DRAFT_1107415 [Mycena alexandri]